MDALEPLDDWMENSDLTKNRFFNAPLEYMQIDGKTYAVPGLNVVYTHVVNTDLLNRAGYSVEDLETWEDVKAAARDISALGDDIYGYAMANGGEGRFAFRDFMMVCLSNGVQPDDTSSESKEKYIEVLQLFKDLAPYMPASQVTWLYPELFRAWESGKIGMMHTGVYFTANLVPHGVSAMPKTTSVVFPKGPSANDRAAMVGSTGFAMFKGSSQKEESWKVIETIFSPEILAKWAGTIGLPAARYITDEQMLVWAKKSYPDAYLEHSRLMSEFSANGDAYGIPMPKILGQKPMEKVVQQVLIDMMSGRISVEKAYDDIKVGIDRIKKDLQ